MARSTRFTNAINEDEEDFVINDDDDDDDEALDQLEKMKRLEAERKGGMKSGGTLMSAYTNFKGGREGLSSASTRIVDLTTD